MQGTRKGIYKRRNKIVKKIIYQTVRYHFFLFISVKSLLKKAKKKKKSKNRQKTETDISPKKIYRWSIGT